MVESIKPLVLITGVTGYLASHVCFEFLKSGNFKLRGSVRDLPNKTELLKKIYGDYLT
jgi:thioester reductase-like protein